MQGKPFYLSPKVLVADAEGRYLIIQRSRESTYWPGQWDLPGGKMDEGETFEQTLIRETREETGLTITLENCLGATRFSMPHAQIVFLIMSGIVTGGQLQLSEEHEAHRWVQGRALASVDFCEPITQVIRRQQYD